MKSLWNKFGHLIFWLSWPIWYVYLQFGPKRTRVLIRCGGELLVIKGWLSSDAWLFPGGGLHRGEDPVQGAIREVEEETGVSLKPDQLTYIFERVITTPQRIKFPCLVYGVELKQKPAIKGASLEVTEVAWQPIAGLQKQPAASLLLNPALTAWSKLT